MIGVIWRNDLRHWLIWINFIAFSALIIYVLRTVLSPRRTKSEGDRTPANLTPFYEDEDLESRRLERVQGWALIFAAIFAIALPLYWLREPTRQTQSTTYFDKLAVARGAVLFANSASPEYNAAVSLQCANCHGQEGVGGAAPTTVNGVKVNWKVPALNTEALRFEEDTDCANQSRRQAETICDLTDIITYGRPGTPMQPWGVAGGGPKNAQSISDLVAYIESIQITPEESQKAAADALVAARSDKATDVCPEYTTCPGIELANAKITLGKSVVDLATKRKETAKVLNTPLATEPELTAQCTDLIDKADAAATPLEGDALDQAVACGEFIKARQAVADRDRERRVVDGVETPTGQRERRSAAVRAELRACHTQGWSVFDPTVPPGAVNSVDILGLSGGGGGEGGGIGFNLRNGGVIRRFGTDENGGFLSQSDFVSNGSAPFKPYGLLGLGSGKMPGFHQGPTTAAPYLGPQLTEDQVKSIVAYERYCLEVTTYKGVTPPCDTSPRPRTPQTTTTVPLADKG